jgi:hypothetical protein
VDPEAIPAIGDQTHTAQLRQVPGDVGLRRTEGLRELAHAELIVLEHQHEATQSGGMSQRGEQGLGAYMHAAEYTVVGM